MRLRLITAASEWPVSLDEAKAQLRVDHTDDDTLIEAKIAALADWLSVPPNGWLNRSLCTQTIELALPRWPYGCIALPYGPAASIASVRYYDLDNAIQTVDSADYFLDGDELVFVDGFFRPATYVRPGALLIRYTAGVGDPAALPSGLREAFLVALTALYEHRGEMVSATMRDNQTAMSLFSSYRLWTA